MNNIKCLLSSIIVFFMLGVLLVPELSAQDVAAGKDLSQEKQTQEKAQADVKAQTDNANEVKQFESFDAYKKYSVAAMRAYFKRSREAKSVEERQAVRKTMPQVDPYLDQIESFVRNGSEQEAAKVVGWWMHGSRGRRDAERIMNVLIEAHCGAEFMVKYVPRVNFVIPPEKAEAIHRAILKENSFDSVKASASYALLEVLENKVKTLEGDVAEATNSEIESLRESFKNEYAEALDVTGVSFADRIEGATFARRLAIGKPVPDIVGKDLDGVEFKLSDYKGKVVLLDFWGDW